MNWLDRAKTRGSKERERRSQIAFFFCFPSRKSEQKRSETTPCVFFVPSEREGALSRWANFRMGRSAPLLLLTIACAFIASAHADERSHRVSELEGDEQESWADASLSFFPTIDPRPLNLDLDNDKNLFFSNSTSAATRSASGSTRSGPITTRSRRTTTTPCRSAAPRGGRAAAAAAPAAPMREARRRGRRRRESGAGSARRSWATAWSTPSSSCRSSSPSPKKGSWSARRCWTQRTWRAFRGP